MPAESLRDAALILYGLAAEEFVKARNALEKDVRQAGDRDLAAQIKALRKPSVLAASLNALARADPGAVDRLLASVADLRAAHVEIADGGEPNFTALQGQYRQAIQALVDLADEARRMDLQAALEAAAIDPQSHHLLRTGTFADAHPSQLDRSVWGFRLRLRPQNVNGRQRGRQPGRQQRARPFRT